jgi:altronate dehydratase
MAAGLFGDARRPDPDPHGAQLVRAGATVMFSEVTEVHEAVHLLTARARDEEVAEALIREMDWYDRYLERGPSERSANPSPGNARVSVGWPTRST